MRNPELTVKGELASEPEREPRMNLGLVALDGSKLNGSWHRSFKDIAGNRTAHQRLTQDQVNRPALCSALALLKSLKGRCSSPSPLRQMEIQRFKLDLTICFIARWRDIRHRIGRSFVVREC